MRAGWVFLFFEFSFERGGAYKEKSVYVVMWPPKIQRNEGKEFVTVISNIETHVSFMGASKEGGRFSQSN